MTDFLMPMAILAVWFILVRYILPHFGVST
jgi:hypothetical protein